MWELKSPQPVKLIIGILAANEQHLGAARDALAAEFGPCDLISDAWLFNQTAYYEKQSGPHLLRQFVTIAELIDPGELADCKHRTNRIEQNLSETLAGAFPRPVNLDPGIIEPSKLILASTKNFSHRIYIGKKMYAEVTLVFDKGTWRRLPYTYRDYLQLPYLEFFDEVKSKLLRQLKSATHKK
ncbi:MAG: DUF4416 family protein [Phycisphaerales bacterium]|nr:MAG: DUF4416 family protein [Phycisphaerales bacterium]